MSDGRWRRADELFHAAIEQPPGARAAWLAAECAGDEALRATVERLVAAHERAGSFIETPALAHLEAPADGRSPTGRIVGPWRIVREIGHGGMGTVYLAERADGQFDHRVALKLVRRGMDTESVLRRFFTERRILASLAHPNIAPLYDGGTTDDGLPYFAMAYIEGEPIDRWCDERRLPVPRRLELFRQVCAAVAYAHQNLVVHRDIKPSNVLVGADGVVRLLDFGIARILDDSENAEPRTVTGMQLLTPEYASPEQLRGAPATTLSDVFALGSVLYALVCGRPARAVTTRALPALAQRAGEAGPARPSEAVRAAAAAAPEGGATPEAIAAARGTTPDALVRRLRGDVDTIVLKALHPEPQRRYSSVEQLSEDLRRHLAGLPVIARPDTLAYRTRKFVRRNMAAVLAGALLALVLLAGATAAAWLMGPRLERAWFDWRTRPSLAVGRTAADYAGRVAGGAFGTALAEVGDVNGDGLPDLLVGAVGEGAAGRAYLFTPGAAEEAPWLVFEGEAPGDQFGGCVASVGDLNGDGHPDFAIGAILADAVHPDVGRVYVHFGGPGLDSIPDLVLDGTRPLQDLGFSIAAAGDVNGDGFGDLIVGAPTDDSAGIPSGRAFVWFGGPSMHARPDLELTERVDGSQYGVSVAGIGDFDGDGFDDVAVGANWDRSDGPASGRVYVYFGGRAMDAGADLVLRAPDAGSEFGMLTPSADLDGDGHPDIVVGAYRANGFERRAGAVYVFRGGPGADDRYDLRVRGGSAGDGTGLATACADVDGDGVADLVVASRWSDTRGERSGRVCVYRGGPRMDDLPDLVLDGFVPFGEFGTAVAARAAGAGAPGRIAVGAPLESGAARAGGRVRVLELGVH